MKIKYVLVLALLALVALFAAACTGPEKATPTTQAGIGVTEEVTTPTVEAATPAASETITATGSITPTGGVDVALAAIQPVDGVLATVNDQEITWADYEPELRRALYSVTQQYGVDWNQADNIALLGTLQEQVLQNVVDRTLLRQLAAKEEIAISQTDLQTRLEEETKGILDSGQFGSWEQFKEQAGISDDYFARLVEDAELVTRVSEAHAPAREAEQVHARHILVADEETGKQVLARLNAGEDWAALAKEYSQDTGNKDNAGDLGWFPRGAMVAEFEEVAFSLEPGKTSDLVQTQYGYHIIQVLEKGMREMDEASYSTALQQAFQKWLDEQKAAAQISITATFLSER